MRRTSQREALYPMPENTWKAALREELREADASLAHVLTWAGGALVGAVVATVVLNVTHHAPLWLLVAFFIGMLGVFSGAVLLRIDRRAGRARNWAQETVHDYKRRVQLVLELRRMADVLADQYLTLREWASLIETNQTARDQFHLDEWIESFKGLAEGSASLLAGAGLTDLAEQYRVQTDAEGHLIPPAAIDQGSLESLNDVLNATTQYRQALTSLAVERLREV